MRGLSGLVPFAGVSAPTLSKIESLFGRRAFRYSTLLALDGAAAAAALYLAFVLRFEGRIPPEWRATIPGALAILVPVRMAMTALFGLHRWSFRLPGFHEAVRLETAALTGSACFVAAFYFFQKLGPPRSVILMEFFLTSAAMATLRFSPRLASGWYVDRQRSRQEGARRTVIVGAGSAGDLLLRDLQRSDEHSYRVVGFVDDDARKIGTYLGGRPVLGRIDDLPEVIERHEVSQVLIAIPRLPAERIQTILRLCSRLKVHFKIIPVSFTYLNEQDHGLDASRPLARGPPAARPDRLRRGGDPGLVSGKRILVTGAPARSAARSRGRSPATAARASSSWTSTRTTSTSCTASCAKSAPTSRSTPRWPTSGNPAVSCGWARSTPQVVFHAAAHKHVPLMEDAPEEAVKNNVFGTLNVARMAEACGAERFVLISTDKAVHPSSVMGASKRIAELRGARPRRGPRPTLHGGALRQRPRARPAASSPSSSSRSSGAARSPSRTRSAGATS